LKKIKPFLSQGIKVASTPAEACKNADIVFSCLMDDNSLHEITTCKNGILDGLSHNGIHVCISTVSASITRKLSKLHEKHGSFFLSSPILGRPEALVLKKTQSYISGHLQALPRALSLIEIYSPIITVLGHDSGLANNLKLITNYLLFSFVDLASQVFCFAEKSALSISLVYEFLFWMIPNPNIYAYAGRLKDRNYDEVGFSLQGSLKDFTLMMNASEEVEAPLSFASSIRDKMVTTSAHLKKEQDWPIMHEITRSVAGLTSKL